MDIDERRAATTPSPPRRRVLVIAQDPGVRALLAAVTEVEGREVRAVPHSSAASAALINWRPDAIVLDLDVPGTEPRALVATYRALIPPELPIIVLMAHTQLSQASMEAIGAAGSLPKPFAVADLVALLDRLMTGS